MAEPTSYRYDVFISYHPRDGDWVWDWLLPRLEQAGLRVCIDQNCFQPGAPVATEIERAVGESRRTLAMMTPAWVESQWDQFEALLIQQKDAAARIRRLIPLLLKPCDPPDRIKLLQWVDFTDAGRQEEQLGRVIDDIKGVSALPELRRDVFPEPRQRRWELRWFAVAGVAAMLTLMVLVGWIWWQVQPKCAKTMLPNEYNIAIAEFLPADSEDNTRPDQDSLRFAQATANYLQGKLDKLNESLFQQVRVDGPNEVCGLDRVTSQNAESIAKTIKASILIYGEMAPRSKQEWELQLDLYFPWDTVKDLAPELTGSQPFGKPIPFVNDGTGSTSINAEIEQRLESLIPVIQGLQFFSHGNTTGFETSLAQFEQVGKTEWGQSSELVQIFLGHSYLRADYMANEYSHLQQAEAVFRRAIQLNPKYARAHNGLGAVLYLKAYWEGRSACGWDEALLEQSYEARKLAYDLATGQEDATMSQLSAQFGMARAMHKLGKCRGDVGALLDAGRDYEDVAIAYAKSSAEDGLLAALMAYEELGDLELHAACLIANSGAETSLDSRELLTSARNHLNHANELMIELDTKESAENAEDIELLISMTTTLLEISNPTALPNTCKEVIGNVDQEIP